MHAIAILVDFPGQAVKKEFNFMWELSGGNYVNLQILLDASQKTESS